MFLTPDSLALDASPRAAADARRWVGEACRRLGRPELVECAELAVSELVTNAVLHARPPLAVRLRGTATHPRFEVLDGSTSLPAPRPPAADGDPDDFLTTLGRGLSLVAMSAEAWGATVEPAGKVVWIEPTSELRDTATEGVFDSVVTRDHELPDDAVTVELRGLDTELHRGASQSYAELRRELRLLALAHEDAYPLAADLSATFSAFEGQFHPSSGQAIEAARRAGRRTLDLVVPISPAAAPNFRTMIDMFDLADAFCRAERLLSLQRTPEQRVYHEWLLGEFIRQLAGEAPLPWPGSAAPAAVSHVS